MPAAPDHLEARAAEILAELEGVAVDLRTEAEQSSQRSRTMLVLAFLGTLGVIGILALGVSNYSLNRQVADQNDDIAHLVAQIDAATGPDAQARSNARLQDAINRVSAGVSAQVSCDVAERIQVVLDQMLADGLLGHARDITCPPEGP